MRRIPVFLGGVAVAGGAVLLVSAVQQIQVSGNARGSGQGFDQSADVSVWTGSVIPPRTATTSVFA